MFNRLLLIFKSQKPIVQRVLIIICSLILIAILYGLCQLIQARENANKLTLYGNVDIRYVNLGFRVPGRITQMRFEEGDYVKANDVLAVLDKQPYLAVLEEAQANMLQAKANFAKLQHGNRPQEIEQARALVEQQQAAFVNSEINLNRQIKLVPSGASTKENYDNATALRDEAQASLKNAQEGLRLALEGFRQEDIEAGQAAFESAQAALLTAQINLSDTEILAPAAGQLLTRVQEPGAVVAAGTSVYILSLLNPVWVRAYVEEPDLGRIKPGMKALIYTDSRSEPFKAQIGYISSEAEFTPKNVQTEQLRTSLVYRIRLIADDPKGILRQGMPVTVKIKLL